MLRLLTREPFGFLPSAVAHITDRQLVAILTARYDDEGSLVTQRRGPPRVGSERWRRERLDRAGSELPAPEAMDIPGDVLEWFARRTGGDLSWVVMFYTVWRRRGLSAGETTVKFCEETGYRRAQG